MHLPILSRRLARPRNLILALLLSCGATSALAQAYPSRPIRLIVPYAAGQGTDVAARFVAEQLARELGGNIVVENRAAAWVPLVPISSV